MVIEIRRYRNGAAKTAYLFIDDLERYGYIKLRNQEIHVYNSNPSVTDGFLKLRIEN